MSRRHIAYVLPVADPKRGGAESWLGALLPNVMAAGHQVSVICRRGENLPTGVTAVTLPAGGTAAARIRSFWEACDKHLEATPYDIVHALDLCPRATILNPHGGCEEVWLQQYLNSKQGIEKWWSTLRRRWGARQRLVLELNQRQFASPTLRRVIAISPFVKESLQAHHNLPDEIFRLIPNGIDTARFTPAASEGERLRLRSTFGLTPTDRVLLFVAHNFALKGLGNAVGILAHCLQEHPTTRLVVIGRGQPALYRRQARALGVANALRFVGATDELPQWYRAADVLLAPTWYDACSLATLEALASGLPVVTTQFNGAKLYLDAGVTGQILEDPADLAGAAQGIATLTTRAAAMQARTAGPRAAAPYTREENFRALLNCYEEIWKTGTNSASIPSAKVV